MGLVLAGGHNREAGLMDTAEMSADFGSSFSALPSLPRAIQGSCLVLVDGGAIVIGGFDGEVEFYRGQSIKRWVESDSYELNDSVDIPA